MSPAAYTSMPHSLIRDLPHSKDTTAQAIQEVILDHILSVRTVVPSMAAAGRLCYTACPEISGSTWTRHVLRLSWRRDLVYHAATAIPLLHHTATSPQLIRPSHPGTRLGAGGGGLRRRQGRVAPGYWESLHSLASDDGAALHYSVADHGSVVFQRCGE